MKALAHQVAQGLAERGLRVVFAESCTAGLVSASLAAVPGISNHLCGSMVTYREASKIAWLGVSQTDLQRASAVSEVVTRQMALNVLQQTPEANISAAVTGHLGPAAPGALDGRVFISIANRPTDTDQAAWRTSDTRHHLTNTSRVARQHETVDVVLQALLTELAITEQRA